MVVAANSPRIVFEDDIEALGDDPSADLRYALHRCNLGACDIAYLGVGLGSMLLSHAYWITPRAASMMLKITKDDCNAMGQDYSMQTLCLQQKARCTLPPRGLYPKDRVGTQGWGLFVQNNRKTPSYNKILNNARGHSWNWTVALAERFTNDQRC